MYPLIYARLLVGGGDWGTVNTWKLNWKGNGRREGIGRGWKMRRVEKMYYFIRFPLIMAFGSHCFDKHECFLG